MPSSKGEASGGRNYLSLPKFFSHFQHSRQVKSVCVCVCVCVCQNTIHQNGDK
ncbi:hypothetical protein ACU4GD_40940 [Cupriavidus basilensis]